MSNTLLGVCIAQGLAFIAALLVFSFRAGRLLERVDSHEQRLDVLEAWRDRSRRFTNSKEDIHA